mmetsp:Transcript_6129/g.6052  ORF Transcript_6129/g.6052 Transcript_6129/m.6052 type:complete len:81 (+) Transcript_6129:59-301(+)
MNGMGGPVPIHGGAMVSGAMVMIDMPCGRCPRHWLSRRQKHGGVLFCGRPSRQDYVVLSRHPPHDAERTLQLQPKAVPWP